MEKNSTDSIAHGLSKPRKASSARDTTPSSRLALVNSLNETKQQVRKADPNKNRCLVENCDEGRVVDFVHVCPKSFANDEDKMDNVEWHWKMVRNTLNLDTRWNIMRLGSSIHKLFDNLSWILVPEQRIVDRYYQTIIFARTKFISNRANFPEIANGDYFKYTFLPIKPGIMSKIAILRQNDPPKNATSNNPRLTTNDFVVHTYPFHTIPTLKSHVHPKFVILEAGHAISKLTYTSSDILFTDYPILRKIGRIYEAWTANRPNNWEKDETYNVSSPGPNDRGGGDADSEYTDNSRTKPQTRTPKRPRQDNPDTPTPGPVTRLRSGSGNKGKQRALKREPSLCLSKKSLEIHDNVIGTGDKWTHDAVQEWSGKCRPLPETAHTPWSQFPTGVCV